MMDPTKRTRKNVCQSKGGCFTCRARRKKCGEEKPCCQRCLKAKFTCGGYPISASPVLCGSSPPTVPKSESQWGKCLVPLCHAPRDARCTRLHILGLSVLCPRSTMGVTFAHSSIWSTEVPQISFMNDAVYTAVTSFGAMYEATTLAADRQESPEHFRALRHYRLALSKLQSELSTHANGILPFFVASVLLAAVETLQGQLENALLHITGAFAFLKQQHPSETAVLQDSKILTHQHTVETNTISRVGVSRLYAFAQILDVQVAAFALGIPPRLPSVSPQTVNLSLLGQSLKPHLDDIGTQVISHIHACLHFASTAAPFKYVARSYVPLDISTQQCCLIAQLSQWIQLLRRALRESREEFLLVLQANCLSILIYLSAILSPYERAYDAFHYAFQEIILFADRSLVPQTSDGILPSPSHRYHLLVSFAQPLFFTALKCRDKEVRQNAINLLRLTGREGPWDSRIHAEVAQRVLDIEEEYSNNEPLHHTSYNIPEKGRICGSGVERYPSSAAYPQSVLVSHSRCIDVDRMVNSVSLPYDAKENWEMWSETVTLK